MGLKELRSKRELTRKELALLSGISFRTIQNYEQGSRELNKASGENLYRLSKALKCRMEDLIDVSKIE